MATDFIPSREVDLRTWSLGVKEQLLLDPAAYGVTAAQAASFAARQEAFADALTLASSNSTRTPSSITAKNLAKRALIAEARAVARIVRAAPGVTDAQKVTLGLTVPDRDLTRIAKPDEPPAMTLRSMDGNRVRVRLTDRSSPTRRGKPPGVVGAIVFYYIGRTPPANIREWTFERSTTRLRFEVQLPASVQPGEQVWFSAFWLNPRLQAGPSCPPVWTHMLGGVVKSAA